MYMCMYTALRNFTDLSTCIIRVCIVLAMDVWGKTNMATVHTVKARTSCDTEHLECVRLQETFLSQVLPVGLPSPADNCLLTKLTRCMCSLCPVI